MDCTSLVRERQLGHRGSREGFLEKEGGKELDRNYVWGEGGAGGAGGRRRCRLGRTFRSMARRPKTVGAERQGCLRGSLCLSVSPPFLPLHLCLNPIFVSLVTGLCLDPSVPDSLSNSLPSRPLSFSFSLTLSCLPWSSSRDVSKRQGYWGVGREKTNGRVGRKRGQEHKDS